MKYLFTYLKKEYFYLLAILFTLIFAITMINSYPTFDNNYNLNISSFEDLIPLFSYNFSAITRNTTSNEIWTFSIIGLNSSMYGQQNASFYYWINLDSSTGVITFNTTNDNQTGMFNISIFVKDQYNNGESRTFFFYINASNDYPNITSINNNYNLSASVTFNATVNGTDEENHLPLIFNLTFYNNCTKRSWNNRANCSLFNFINISNTSAIINFTSTKYDAGEYYANVTLTDSGSKYNCISGFCLANYSQNRTFYYPQTIKFNVYTYLEVNASNCNNRIFQENQSNTCMINITSRESTDSIFYKSKANLTNITYSNFVANSSWFFTNLTNNSNNFILVILINVTPQKNAIGNWTINFSAIDNNFSEYNYALINISVNRTNNAPPMIKNIADINASTFSQMRINITVHDDDLLIPDKLAYNETINYTIVIANSSNLSQTFNFTQYNFTVQTINYSILGSNRTEAKIELVPPSAMAGNFSVNVTATDSGGINSSVAFNLSIKGNFYPQWSQNFNRNFTIFEHSPIYLNLSENVSDANSEDMISFNYSLSNYFPSFSMNKTTGIINFTGNDSDVGLHIVTISASDGFLINSTTINFTILNINESPIIIKPLSLQGSGTIDSNSNMNLNEDSSNKIIMYVIDNDNWKITNHI